MSDKSVGPKSPNIFKPGDGSGEEAPLWIRAAMAGLGDTCLLLLTPEGVVLDVVGSGLEGAGLDAGEAVGRPLEDFLDGMDDEDLESLAADVLDEDSPESLEIMHGGRILSLTLSPLGGDEPRLAAALRDVTEEVLARHSCDECEVRLEALFGKALNPIMVTDAEGRYIDANESALEFFETGRENLLNRTVWDFAAPGTEERTRKLHTSLEEPETVRMDYLVGGRSKTMLLNLVPVNTDDGVVIYGIGQDMTESRKIELDCSLALTKFRLMFSSLPMPALVLNADGLVEEVNDRAAALLGLPVDKIAGGRLRDFSLKLVTSDQIPISLEQLPVERVFTGEQAVQGVEFGLKNANDDLIWLSVTASPIPGPGGGLICTLLDITDRKRLDVATARENVFNASLAGLSEKLLMARSLSDMAELTLNEGLRLTGSELGCVGYQDPNSGLSQVHIVGNRVQAACRLEHKMLLDKHSGLWGLLLDGREPVLSNDLAGDARSFGLPEGHVEIRRFLGMPAMQGDKHVGYIALANPGRDYTSDDVAILERLASIYALSIGRMLLERELSQARDASEAANRAKSEFLANMSHEIRTPLNGMLGMLQLMALTPLNASQKGYVEAAHASGKALLTLFTDILDFTVLEAERVELRSEPLDVARVMRDVADIFRPEAAAKGLAFQVMLTPKVPASLVGDPARIRQTLFQLTANAVKFTDSGWVRLSADYLPAGEATSARLSFQVSDTGEGIPPEKLELMFEPFTQLDGSFTRVHEGTGLGLGIVKRLVALLGGEMNLHSEPGKGTTFTFTVPVRVEGCPVVTETRDIARDPSRLKGKQVLLAEDNAINREATMDMLKQLGMQAAAVTDGRKALDFLAEHKVDVVLMDVQMPNMDGLEATARIRESEATRDLPVIALTAHAMAGDRRKFIDSGMDDYLAKPFEMADLARVLGAVLAKGE